MKPSTQPAKSYQFLPTAAGLIVIFIGSLVLIGWFFNILPLQNILSDLPKMTFNTALLLVIAALALFFNSITSKNYLHLTALILAAVLTLASLLFLSEYLFNINLGIDQLLFKDPAAGAENALPGRPSPHTAVTFLLTGLSLLLFNTNTNRNNRIAQFLSLTGAFIPLLALVGYVYGIPFFFRINNYTGMALHTALSFIILFIGLLFLRPHLGIMALVTGRNLSSVLSRRLLLVVTAIPLLHGWLILLSNNPNLNQSAQPVLVAVGSAYVLAGAVWWYASTLNQIIIQRTKMEKKLRKSERYFRALIENTSDIIITLDANGQITYASPALARIIDYQTAEFEGQNLLTLLHQDNTQNYKTLFDQLLQESDSSFSTQFQLQHKDGTWLWFEVIMTNLLADPSINAIVANLRNITESKKLQAQLLQAQKMEAVGQLTAGIAHDFNNILTVINSYAELLQLHLPKEKSLRRMAGRIFESGERAANLVRRLLTFSRKQIINPETLDLNDIVTKMYNMLDDLIGDHILVSTNLMPNLWLISADKSQLEQIIVNLAVNARDAMPSGGNLTIETANIMFDTQSAAAHIDLKPGPYIQLTMCDNGIGMSEEVISHLFEPFFTTKEEGKGTGLGLATVYGIVKQSNGAIFIESKLNQGTTINIFLPRTENTETTQSIQETTPGPILSNQTILLVEDNEGVRDIARKILQDLGYTILVAQNGKEALDISEAHQGSIHLLLTDVVMPGTSGQMLAEQLQKKLPRLKVLFMTGYSEEIIANFGVVAPKIDLLQKPFAPQDLIRKVRDLLNEN